jgi:hypothetical protein
MVSNSTNSGSFGFVVSATFLFSLSITTLALAQSNTSLGAGALQNNFTGSNNTALGADALLYNTTGSANTASGDGALFNNITGDFNTASGTQALFSNTTGIENTAIGVNALYSNTAGTNNTATGLQALLSNTTGNDNTASGVEALLLNTTGGGNTAIGDHALGNNTTGSNNTAVGTGANVSVGNLTNATAIGSGAVVNASNKIRLGNTGVTVIEGQVPYTFTSDKTKKENFQAVNGEEVLRKIRGFELTSWNFIGHDPKEFRHYGPMAQDFFAAFGHDGVGQIGTETTINSGDIAGILMIAVQALEKRTAELKETKAQVADLAARLEALESLQKQSIQITADQRAN